MNFKKRSLVLRWQKMRRKIKPIKGERKEKERHTQCKKGGYTFFGVKSKIE